MIARGVASLAAVTASATAHIPKSSAAGIDSTGGAGPGVSVLSALRSDSVAAPLRSASFASSGHASDTSHAIVAPVTSRANDRARASPRIASAVPAARLRYRGAVLRIHPALLPSPGRLCSPAVAAATRLPYASPCRRHLPPAW
eukprot:6178782-Pleurochrysis_carterae.AAC.1